MIFFEFLLPCGGYNTLLRKSEADSVGQALEWSYTASTSASTLRRWVGGRDSRQTVLWHGPGSQRLFGFLGLLVKK